MPSDPENVNFLDLACIFKIGEDTTLERFGSVINASVFDAANITGSLKQKGLIDFTAYYPGPNSIIVTEAGKKLKADAEAKGSESLDSLDEEILKHLSGGKRFPTELQSTLNIRSKDLAFRIYKLFKQNFMSYELKNGKVELMLTEQGFLRTKGTPTVQAPKPMQAQPMQKTPQPQGAQADEQAQPQPQQTATGAQATPGNGADLNQMASEIKLHGKPHKKLYAEVAIAVIVIVAILYYVYAYMPGTLPAI